MLPVSFADSLKHRRFIILVVIACLLLGAAPARAEWHTLQAGHFLIHYPEAKRALALDVAVRAEAVHELLTERLGHAPAARTHLVLWHGTDLANGYATPLFENQIGVYLTLPSLADQYLAGFAPSADDWLTLLLLHEYAHILHLDLRSESAERLRSILGRVPLITSPLLMAPPLVLEGFAVYHESLDGAGRGNGTYYDMFLRAAVLEDRLPRVDQVLGEYPLGRWRPGGHVYFYGYAFVRYLAERYGPDILNRLNEELVRRPDTLSGALQNVVDAPLHVLWDEWRAHVTEKVEDSLARLAAAPVTRVTVYETAGYHALFPTPSPDGTTVAYVALGGAGSELRLIDSASGKERRLSDGELLLTTTIAWHPDGTKLVVAEAQEERAGFWVTQLVEVDVQTGGKRRIPGTRHAFSPAFDPTGERLAYIRRDGLVTELWVLERTTGEHKRAALPQDVTLLALRWAPAGDLLALSVWDGERGGYLALYDAAGGTFTPLLGGGDAIYDPPSWCPDGQALLFASDRSGVFDIYRYEFGSGRITRLTRTLTGLFYPMASAADAVTAMLYTADGYRLARLDELAEEPGGALWLPPPAPVPLPDAAPELQELGRYSVWTTLRPTFWLPAVSYGAGESLVQLFTAGQDVLGRVAYTATVGAGFPSGRPLYDIEWQQQLGEGTGLSLRFGARRLPQILVVEGARHPFETSAGTIGLEWRRPASSGTYTLWLAAQRFAAESDVPDVPAVRTTEVAAGISHRQGRTYFDWRLVRELRLEVTSEPAAEGAWSARVERSLKAGHTHGLDVAVELAGAAAGSGRAVALGAAGSAQGIDLPLRGYRTAIYAGNVAWKGTVEASIPLLQLQRGMLDAPVFLRDVRLHPFVEGGWTKAYGAEQGAFAWSFGAELGFRTYLAFGATAVDLRIGLARGGGEPGPQLYLRVESNF